MRHNYRTIALGHQIVAQSATKGGEVLLLQLLLLAKWILQFGLLEDTNDLHPNRWTFEWFSIVESGRDSNSKPSVRLVSRVVMSQVSSPHENHHGYGTYHMHVPCKQQFSRGYQPCTETSWHGWILERCPSSSSLRTIVFIRKIRSYHKYPTGRTKNRLFPGHSWVGHLLRWTNCNVNQNFDRKLTMHHKSLYSLLLMGPPMIC